MPTTIERASEQLANVAASLKGITGSARAAGQLLELLGWSLPPGVDDIGLTQLDLSKVIARVDELAELRTRGDATDLELAAAVGEIVVALAQTFSHVEDLARSLQATPDYLAATDIVDQFFPRLADLLVIQAVGVAAPAAVSIGVLIGVFELTPMTADPGIFQVHHVRQVVRWDRFSPLLTDPTALLQEVYGWGAAGFNGMLFLTNIGRVLEHVALDVALKRMPRVLEEQIVGHPVPEADAAPAAQLTVMIDSGLDDDTFDVGVMLYSLRASAPGATDAGIGLSPTVSGTADTAFPLSDALSFVLSASADLQGGLALLLRAGRDPELRTGVFDASAGTAAPSLGLALRHAAAADQRLTLFSGPSLTIDAAAITAGIGATVVPTLNPSFRAGIEDGRITVAPDRADGFLASILPADGVTTTVSLDVSWSHQDGVRIEGGAGLRTSIGLHRRLGPLELDTLDVAVTGTATALTATATINGAAVLGPFTAIVERIGAAVVLGFHRGNLGLVDLAIDFVPPTGVGLEVNAAVVSGGGVIRYDPVEHRYSGMLQLQAGQVAITGFGVLDARPPGGGFALLIALRATFPAIQVGFGFALTAVGGLVALNRRVDVDALRAQIASGMAGRILAPEDPIRNAPALFADLGTAFPFAPGISVVGPTAQLIWARLVRFDIAVLIELPGPARIVLLGSARAAIQAEDRTYLIVRVDIVGVVDLERRLAAFDAVLIDSHLMEVLDLTGGALFRLSWGDQPYAVFSLGGFHPAYNPEPLIVPASLTRIAMVHGTPQARLYLRFEGYFAVTSNTLQFGAAVQALIQSGNFNIQGIVGFDALVRREPFHFQIDLRASVRVRYKSRSLAGLTLTGRLEGPGPVVLRAKVCIELLFFDICFSDTYTLGSSVPPPISTIPNALSVLVAELENPATLQASGATDRYVRLRPATEGTEPVVSPVGQLAWVQRQAPLGVLLRRIGGAPLAAPESIEATSADATAPELDWFAPGAFVDLTDDQALTRRGFERLQGGVRLGASGTSDGPGAARTLTIRQIRLPAKVASVRTATAFPLWAVAATTAAEGGPALPRPTRGVVAVGDERWSAVDLATGETRNGLSGTQAQQLAALAPVALQRVAIPVGDRVADFVF